jgi:hypothetical protein
MQDRYFGDIGDFAKYGLLRGLLGPRGESALGLGIVWYLVPDESHTNDGRHTAYLKPTRGDTHALRDCDEELYDRLAGAVATGRRSVTLAREGILPADTAFYETPLTFAGIPQARREASRDAWLGGALQAMRAAQVAFVDPDNGLQVKAGRHSIKGPKYAFYTELRALWDSTKTLIVYQHVSRAGSASDQLQERFQQLRDHLETTAMWALHFRRVSPRFFFVVPQPAHALVLKRRTQEFLSGHWAAHFDCHWSSLEQAQGERSRSRI